MRLTPSQRLCGLGVVLFAALLVCSRSPSGTGGPSFLVPLGFAAVSYLLAVREFFQTQGYPRNVVFACFALAAL